MRLALLVVPALVLAQAAGGAWLTNGLGNGAARAGSLPTAAAPSASVLVRDVTVTWTAVSLPGAGSVGEYRIRRYNAITGVAETVLAGCAGTVLGTSCIEQSVPLGAWRYTVTPVDGLWTGGESGASTTVVV